MKKKSTLLAFLLFSIALYAPALAAFHAEDSYRLPRVIARTHQSIRYLISPQIKLIAIAQTISAYPARFEFFMRQDAFPYKSDVLARFGHFKDHPLVSGFDAISAKPGNLNFSAIKHNASHE